MNDSFISTVCATATSVCKDASAALKIHIESQQPTKVFFIADTNTAGFASELASTVGGITETHVITVAAGDVNKNIDTLAGIWLELSQNGATRRSVIVNVGGGMITDLGGFVAATFKRGIKYINVPTTLLGAVDAATGGKTAINFNGLKNEIGAFALPMATIVSPVYFKTLSEAEFLSGYAEMIKTALLFDKKLFVSMLEPDDFRSDDVLFIDALERCMAHKGYVTGADPVENGLRKTLNLGHTAGHAIESLLLEKKSPVPHGVAVAYGLLVEMILSHFLLSFPSETLHQYARMLKGYYPPLPFRCSDIERLIEFMRHDKKNATPSQPVFTLLEDVGRPVIDCCPDLDDIKQALELTRDMMP